MTRQPVSSSNIKSVGYDPSTLTMHVEFANGGLYEYVGVQPEQHADFVAAKSVGSHFGTHVRGRFETRRLDTPPPGTAA